MMDQQATGFNFYAKKRMGVRLSVKLDAYMNLIRKILEYYII